MTLTSGSRRTALAVVLAATAVASLAAPVPVHHMTEGTSQCPLPPAYPPEALRARATGTTRLQLTIGADHEVSGVAILASAGATPAHKLLDEAATKLYRDCLYLRAAAGASITVEQVWKLDDPGATPQAPPDLLARAEAGEVAAQLALAAYYDVRATPAGEKQATDWYGRAAAQGDATGEAFYGRRILAGKGIRGDDTAAAVWLRKASDQGNALAALTLGQMAQSGRGPDATPQAAIRWLELSATRGLAQAFDELGVAHEQGFGVAPDQALAVEYYCIALRKRFAPADMHLMTIGAKTGDPRHYRDCESATRWLAENALGHAPELPR